MNDLESVETLQLSPEIQLCFDLFIYILLFKLRQPSIVNINLPYRLILAFMNVVILFVS